MVAEYKDLARASELTRQYGVRKLAEVLKFLHEHPFLMPLLEEAPARIVKYFPNITLTLEVVTDPESADQQLLALIGTDWSATSVLDALDQFDRDWWIDNVPSAKGKLCITTDFL